VTRLQVVPNGEDAHVSERQLGNGTRARDAQAKVPKGTVEGELMARYLVERTFFVSEEEMQHVGRRSRAIAEEKFPEITWEHSHVVVDDAGTVKTFCLYGAPDEDTIRRHADQLGEHRVEGIYEVAGDVTPSDFPPV
jgi:hypothetical protein